MVVVLAGGVGAARFLRGLLSVVDPSDIDVIVNVGDDIELHGLHVSPDIDSITYWLAGLVHPDQQWGRADERFTVADELARLGHDAWFTLGDRDLALHIHRTAQLRAGTPLSAITAQVAQRHGLAMRLMPVTDDRIETRIHTVDGRDLHFQRWWVGERAASDVARVEFRGAESARPAPGVVEAIDAADVVIIAPSNPVVSVAPITAVPAVAAALARTRAAVVGVSPIIGGNVVRGMAHRLLPVMGVDVDAASVAAWYGSRAGGGLLDAWVLDTVDAALIGRVRAGGIRATATDTLLDDEEVAASLATTVLGLAGDVASGR